MLLAFFDAFLLFSLDSIFVRVYESMMNVTRAVTIGAQGSEGTSYHDGLFFSIFTFLVASAFPMYRRYVAHDTLSD